MSDTPFWIVSNLSYEDTMKLMASDLVEHYQRDPKKATVRFWPGSQAVFKHLSDNLPEGARISDGKEEKAIKIKAPTVVHKMGMDIADD